MNPMLNGFGVILSAVGLALSIMYHIIIQLHISWENKIGNYELDINKRAFFTLHEIYAK